jgi:hypothetical protein
MMVGFMPAASRLSARVEACKAPTLSSVTIAARMRGSLDAISAPARASNPGPMRMS